MEPLKNAFLNMKYKPLEIITKDNNQQVFLSEKKDTHEKIIIKEINLSVLDQNQKNLTSQEGLLLSQLNHPNIINCDEFHLENDKAYIIMEYGEGGDLSKKIQEQKSKNLPFEENQILDWFIEICEAVRYIHEKNIIHRDLQPNNILLTKNNQIKLTDFGIAKILDGEQQVKTKIGNDSYFSPEIIKGENYDFKTDIWNLGIILYELTQLKHPFEDVNISPQEKLKNIEEGKYFEFTNKKYNSKILELIQNLLSVNPNKRPDINKIILECYSIKIKKNTKSDKE